VAFFVAVSAVFAAGAVFHATGRGASPSLLRRAWRCRWPGRDRLVRLAYLYEMPTTTALLPPAAEYGYVGYPLYATLLGGAVAGMGVGAIAPARRIESLAVAVPVLQRRLASASMLLYAIFTMIVTWRLDASPSGPDPRLRAARPEGAASSGRRDLDCPGWPAPTTSCSSRLLRVRQSRRLRLLRARAGPARAVRPALGVRGEVRVVHTVPPPRSAGARRCSRRTWRRCWRRAGRREHHRPLQRGLDARLLATREASLRPRWTRRSAPGRSGRWSRSGAAPRHAGGRVLQRHARAAAPQGPLPLDHVHHPGGPAPHPRRPSAGPRLPPSCLAGPPGGAGGEPAPRRLRERPAPDHRGVPRPVGSERDLLAQITPAAMDVFNASTQDRPACATGAWWLRRARPPPLVLSSASTRTRRRPTRSTSAPPDRIALPARPCPAAHRAQADALRNAYGRIRTARPRRDGADAVAGLGDVVAAVWATTTT